MNDDVPPTAPVAPVPVRVKPQSQGKMTRQQLRYRDRRAYKDRQIEAKKVARFR